MENRAALYLSLVKDSSDILSSAHAQSRQNPISSAVSVHPSEMVIVQFIFVYVEGYPLTVRIFVCISGADLQGRIEIFIMK